MPATWGVSLVIEIVGITKTFVGRNSAFFHAEETRALRGITLTIPTSGALAIIGESGCGKTTLGRILCGLEPHDGGDLVFDGVSLNGLSGNERRAQLRKIQMVHQDPYAALNPVRTVEKALTDPLKIQARRDGRSKHWIHDRARELLGQVGLDPDETIYKYPHNLSGGQRQRVVVARALTVEPEALVADEAVSMIDVSLRLGILSLLNDLRRRLGITIIFITHDIAAARYVARDGALCVIYRGEVFEYGDVDAVIQAPVNPYTQSLLSAVPVMRGLETPGPDRYIPQKAFETASAEGSCLFSGRCKWVTDHCRARHPELAPISDIPRLNRCFYPKARRVVAIPTREAR